MNTQPEKYSNHYQYLANGLSIGRAVGGVLLGLHIARSESYRKPNTLVGIAALAATDFFDGVIARKGKPTAFGADCDQMADKVFTHALIAGTAVHALRKQNMGAACFLAANQAVQAVRDVWVTGERSKATGYNVPTGAQWPGKVKTFVTMSALIAMAAPFEQTESTPAQLQDTLSMTGIAAGTVLSITSGMSRVESLRQAVAEQQATFAQDDTSQEPLPDIPASAVQ